MIFFFVSTDSLKIAHVSKRYGAQVPFFKEKKFAEFCHYGEIHLKMLL